MTYSETVEECQMFTCILQASQQLSILRKACGKIFQNALHLSALCFQLIRAHLLYGILS